jgi:hypothetical protein
MNHEITINRDQHELLLAAINNEFVDESIKYEYQCKKFPDTIFKKLEGSFPRSSNELRLSITWFENELLVNVLKYYQVSISREITKQRLLSRPSIGSSIVEIEYQEFLKNLEELSKRTTDLLNHFIGEKARSQ